MAYRYVGQQLYAPSLAGNSKWPIKILDYAQQRLERHYFCVKNSKQHRIEKVEEKSREIIMRKKIVEQRLFFYCLYDVLSIKNVATAQPLPRRWPVVLRLRIWFLQELGLMNFILKWKVKKKSIETIGKVRRGILSDSTGENDIFFLNSEASEKEEICGEVVRLSLFAYVLRYIPANLEGN